MDSYMAEDLLRWRRQSIYASDDDYVFVSETMHEKIGWHTSRYSFVTLLKANGEDVKSRSGTPAARQQQACSP
jgi:hypothetical protein